MSLVLLTNSFDRILDAFPDFDEAISPKDLAAKKSIPYQKRIGGECVVAYPIVKRRPLAKIPIYLNPGWRDLLAVCLCPAAVWYHWADLIQLGQLKIKHHSTQGSSRTSVLIELAGA